MKFFFSSVIFIIFIANCFSQEYSIHLEKVDRKSKEMAQLFHVSDEEFVTLNKQATMFEMCRQKFGEEKAECQVVQGYKELYIDDYRYLGVIDYNSDEITISFYKKKKYVLSYYACTFNINELVLSAPVKLGDTNVSKSKKTVPQDSGWKVHSNNRDFTVFINYARKPIITQHGKVHMLYSLYDSESGEMKSLRDTIKYEDIWRQRYFLSDDGIFYKSFVYPQGRNYAEIKRFHFDKNSIKEYIIPLEYDSNIVFNSKSEFEMLLMTYVYIKSTDEFTLKRIKIDENGLKETKIDVFDPSFDEVAKKSKLYLKEIYTTSNNNTYVLLSTSITNFFKKPKILFGKIENNSLKILFEESYNIDPEFRFFQIGELNGKVFFSYLDNSPENYLFKTTNGRLTFFIADEVSDEVSHIAVNKALANKKIAGLLQGIYTSYNHELAAIYMESVLLLNSFIFIHSHEFNEVIRM